MKQKAPIRKEGRQKVTGSAQYVDDLSLPDMLHGTTVRSPVPRGRIKNIKFLDGIPWNEFTIVTSKDIPGKNIVALIENDQPFLVEKIINHAEEPIVLLAHSDKYLLERARTKVAIEVEPLPAILSLDASIEQKEIIWGKDNCFKSFHMKKGNPQSVFAQKYIVIEETYETGAQEQLYIENNGMIASASQANGVTVWGSMQCPYYVHKALKSLFPLPEERIRIVQTETGGGFGGKEDFPSIIAGHAALLSWKSGKPVKIVYDRAEDMVATTKRHPSRTKIKSAVDKNGKFLALEIEFLIDGGAYATVSPVVLSRGTIHAAGPYLCPNVEIKSRAMATNTPPHGAFRGFGAPQSLFALERHMEKIALTLGIPPEEVRKRNFLKTGETTATEQLIKEKLDLKSILDKGLKVSDFRRKTKRFSKENAKSPIKRGMGMATFFHGAGFTGSGEKFLASKVAVEATSDGTIHVLTANTEIGQGTNTIFSQIVADTLGIPYENVIVAQPDTGLVPNSGPTVASRTCMIVGKLVQSAALGIRDTLVREGLLKIKYSPKNFAAACGEYLKTNSSLKVITHYEQPPNHDWDDKNYRGDAYGCFAWAAYIAEVAVDTVTFETQVTHFWAIQEVGKVIHPLLAEGQIIGGVAQGIGWTLYEDVIWKNGKMANNRMTNYIVPTSLDTPPIDVIFYENPYDFGPFGAKGIGELPMDGPAPAILNAIEAATGVSLNSIPLTPELLMKAYDKKNAKQDSLQS